MEKVTTFNLSLLKMTFISGSKILENMVDTRTSDTIVVKGKGTDSYDGGWGWVGELCES